MRIENQHPVNLRYKKPTLNNVHPAVDVFISFTFKAERILNESPEPLYVGAAMNISILCARCYHEQ